MSLRFVPSHLFTGLEQEHFFLMTFIKLSDLGVRPFEGVENGGAVPLGEAKGARGGPYME